jgi:hypothetical protein
MTDREKELAGALRQVLDAAEAEANQPDTFDEPLHAFVVRVAGNALARVQ